MRIQPKHHGLPSGRKFYAYRRAPTRSLSVYRQSSKNHRSLPRPEELLKILIDFGTVTDRETGFHIKPADERIMGKLLGEKEYNEAEALGFSHFPMPSYLKGSQLPATQMSLVLAASQKYRTRNEEPPLDCFPKFTLVGWDGDRTIWNGVLGSLWHHYLAGQKSYIDKTRLIQIGTAYGWNKIKHRFWGTGDYLAYQSFGPRLLQGLVESIVWQLAKYFKTDVIDERHDWYFQGAIDRIQSYQQDPHNILVCASGSSVYPTTALAVDLGFHQVFGSRTRVDENGVITDDIETPLTVFAGKPILVDGWLRIAMRDALKKFLGREPNGEEVNDVVEGIIMRAHIYTDDLQLDQFFARYLGTHGQRVITSYDWKWHEQVEKEANEFGLAIERFDGQTKPENYDKWKEEMEKQKKILEAFATTKGKERLEKSKG